MTFNEIKQSRLDYIIIPKSFIYNMNSINIENSVYSNHNPVHLKLKPNAHNKKGSGFWKFNTSLLRDPKYVNKMNC